jgi:hypothetical protein
MTPGTADCGGSLSLDADGGTVTLSRETSSLSSLVLLSGADIGQLAANALCRGCLDYKQFWQEDDGRDELF